MNCDDNDADDDDDNDNNDKGDDNGDEGNWGWFETILLDNALLSKCITSHTHWIELLETKR